MAASMMQDTHLICSGRMIQMCCSSVPLPTSPAHGLVLKRRGQHERVSMLQISCADEEPVSTPAEASSGVMLSALRTPGKALATLLFASCILAAFTKFPPNLSCRNETHFWLFQAWMMKQKWSPTHFGLSAPSLAHRRSSWTACTASSRHAWPLRALLFQSMIHFVCTG